MARWDEPLFDGHVLVENVEGVLIRLDAVTGDGVLLFASKVIREPATVGVEQFDDLDRARIFYLDQEIGDAIKLVCINIHEDPACCAIYSGPTVRDSGFNYVPHDRIVANGGKKEAEVHSAEFQGRSAVRW